MPNQVDGVLVRAMSGTELSRVRTEFRLRPPEPIKQSLLESRGPTLLCNQVSRKDFFLNCLIGFETKVSASTHLVSVVRPSRRLFALPPKCSTERRTRCG
jgi:hypothetical protein